MPTSKPAPRTATATTRLPHHAPRRIAATLALAATLAGALATGGCAFAPGMDIRKHVELPAGTPAPDAPPPGALTPITPALVQALRSVPEPDPFEELKDFLTEPQPYRIGPADVLGITVWGSPDFSSPTGTTTAAAGSGAQGFTVNSRGAIQVPFLGDVQAAGMTIEEFRDHLTAKLKKLLRDPHVTVAINTYRSGRVYVDGEVDKPGLQVLNDLPMSLPEALSRAGGMTADADRNSIIIARGVKAVRVNPDALVQRGLDPLKILLAAGDIVRVPRRDETLVYVLGEVRGVGPRQFRRGKLSLHEALVMPAA